MSAPVWIRRHKSGLGYVVRCTRCLPRADDKRSMLGAGTALALFLRWRDALRWANEHALKHCQTTTLSAFLDTLPPRRYVVTPTNDQTTEAVRQAVRRQP